MEFAQHARRFGNQGIDAHSLGILVHDRRDGRLFVETAGENELAHFNLGSAYLENNELELAITHFSAAAQMNPHDATTYNNIGIAYVRQKKEPLAEACFRQAIFLNPQIAQPHFHLAVLKINQGLLSEAMEHLNEAVRLAPDWIEARNLRDELINSKR